MKKYIEKFAIAMQRAMIITRDEERTIRHESGLTVEVVPVWKWLMS